MPESTDEMSGTGMDNPRRIRGLVLLLRTSGMRIGDAVNLKRLAAAISTTGGVPGVGVEPTRPLRDRGF